MLEVVGIFRGLPIDQKLYNHYKVNSVCPERSAETVFTAAVLWIILKKTHLHQKPNYETRNYTHKKSSLSSAVYSLMFVSTVCRGLPTGTHLLNLNDSRTLTFLFENNCSDGECCNRVSCSVTSWCPGVNFISWSTHVHVLCSPPKSVVCSTITYLNSLKT